MLTVNERHQVAVETLAKAEMLLASAKYQDDPNCPLSGWVVTTGDDGNEVTIEVTSAGGDYELSIYERACTWRLTLDRHGRMENPLDPEESGPCFASAALIEKFRSIYESFMGVEHASENGQA